MLNLRSCSGAPSAAAGLRLQQLAGVAVPAFLPVRCLAGSAAVASDLAARAALSLERRAGGHVGASPVVKGGIESSLSAGVGQQGGAAARDPQADKLHDSS